MFGFYERTITIDLSRKTFPIRVLVEDIFSKAQWP
jgi:hypothetical protein